MRVRVRVRVRVTVKVRVRVKFRVRITDRVRVKVRVRTRCEVRDAKVASTRISMRSEVPGPRWRERWKRETGETKGLEQRQGWAPRRARTHLATKGDADPNALGE